MRIVVHRQAYRLDRVVGGEGGAVEDVHPAHERADKRGRIYVAGAVRHTRQLGVEVVERLAAFAVVDGDAQFFGVKRHARQHDVAAAELAQRGEQVFDIALVVFRLELLAGHQACLGDVGQDDVRGGAKARHMGREVGRKAGIQFAAVRHRRVDNDTAAAVEVLVDRVEDEVDLARTAQIAGVDAVEFEPLLLPMSGDGRDVVGQIAEGPARLECGVGGQYRCRDDGGLDAARRDDRQRDGERTLSVAGQILNGQNFGIFHSSSVAPWGV